MLPMATAPNASGTVNSRPSVSITMPGLRVKKSAP
jgi:hypothetical protein